MISTTIDVTHPAMDQFLRQSALEDFKPDQLPANIMQLIGIYKGNKTFISWKK